MAGLGLVIITLASALASYRPWLQPRSCTARPRTVYTEARVRRYGRCPWTPARAVNTACTRPV